jgi:hypothetical protein
MSQNNNLDVAETLGPIPEVNAIDPESKSDIFSTAFELYKYTAVFTYVVANLHDETMPNGVLPRDREILAGLLSRIAKFMAAVMQLSDGARDKREVVTALNRSIVESVVNLKFLMTKNEPRFFSQFVEFSLGPERELYDHVQKNIQARGETWPVEDRMLKSIQRICRLSGLSIDEVRVKYGDWGGGLRERLKAIGFEDGYVSLQRIPSHSVHGSWVDLLFHYLKDSDDGFIPRTDRQEVDPRLWLPTCVIVANALSQYLETYFSEFQEFTELRETLVALQERVLAVEKLHEDWFCKIAGSG